MSTEHGEQSQSEDFLGWDAGQIGTAIGVEPDTTERFPYGACQRFSLQDGVELELFAPSRVARLRAADFELTLSGVTPSLSQDELGTFLAITSTASGQPHVLAFRPGGRFAFGPVAPEATNGPPENHDDAPEDAAEEASPSQEAATTSEQERVDITGRVFQSPSFHTTPKGVRLARFQVNEESEIGGNVLHTVLAFNRQAVHIEERPLDPDEVVQVIGYPHQRVVTRDGQQITLTEIYAAAVRRKQA